MSLYAELQNYEYTNAESVPVANSVTLRPYQEEAVDAIYEQWDSGVQSTLASLPTGCHALGHPILKYDGDILPVERVRVGDVLCGPDGSPRKVLQLCRGTQDLFRITCKRGPSFVVNADHILHLECTRERGSSRYPCQKQGGEIDHITVADYLNKSPSWRHVRKMKSVAFDFENGFGSHHVVPPYVVGALLGDGTVANNRVVLHSQDSEVVTEVASSAERLGCTIKHVYQRGKTAAEHHIVSQGKWSRTDFKNDLIATGVYGQKCATKYVPDLYKLSSRACRLELLAGLIDTDGSYDSGCYDFVSKSQRLARDVQFMSRTVGLRANCRACTKTSQNGTRGTYWRVTISGNVEVIPCRIKRKKAEPRRQIKDWSRMGFEVEYAGVGPYYGFTLDGDHLYLDGNFIVHHNTGKSVIFSEVMDRWLKRDHTKRILVIAHREELIFQAVGHAKRVGEDAGIEMGSYRANGSRVVISTVQTQVAKSRCRDCLSQGCPICDGTGKIPRMQKFRAADFGLVIIDEAHHGPAATYRRMLQHYMQNPRLKILGVTATPQRSDKAGLWNVFETSAYEMDLRKAISEGWLVPIRQQFVEVGQLDLSKVDTKAGGDLADGQLEAAMLGHGDTKEEEELLHAIAKPTLEVASGKPVLVFASGVDHAEKLAGAFNVYDGVRAEVVLGKTDKKLRKKIIDRYKSGVTHVLVGCGVFTEGFDAPGTEILAVARPTKSTPLYTQMIGRATRPLPGTVDGLETAEERRFAIEGSTKPNCVILDFVGNSGRHKLVSVADVLAGMAVRDDDLESAKKLAVKESTPQDMEELLKKAKQARQEMERQNDLEEAAYRARYKARRAEYSRDDVDLFFGSGFDPMVDYEPGPLSATRKQVKYLMSLGVSPRTACGYSKKQAGAVIDSLQKRTGGNATIPFGKYRGTQIRLVPRSYLGWMLRTCNLRPELKQNIQTHLGG